ncbi:MFS transporter [Aliigemmobacter aestuarii]|uniref:MFS transporter n=1 Tax=Aliigemmobacter aestuarii TaxID=1445661 RepID=A0A4S3MT30_9RHOB|nr:MFS transporter [Gemmobacter aestuarii]THD85738.1 MFS transporter [Gemmobacter aestuarii]
MTSARKRIWGWYFFDWASQPYNTLLLTFIFGPYITQVIGDGTEAQAIWGYGIALAGVLIAIFSPILGAIADNARGQMPFIWLFSIMYVVGAWGLWLAHPDDMNIWTVMIFFGIGLIGMEFATNFTNALMPDLGPAEDMGRISGSGWAFGYIGGVLALVVMLVLFDDSAGGKTLIGIDPILGLDSAEREGTRAVGPLTAIWYIVFMIPFFLWVKEPKRRGMPVLTAARRAVPDLMGTLRSLPARQSLFAYLMSSMFYRDALNGMYTFGGIYAAGMLGWQPIQMGVFGILAALTGALFAWLGGHADSARGPKPVIAFCLIVLTLVALGIVFVSREAVFGMPVGPDSALPDIAFYVLGGLIGAAGGALQSSSRTMMIRQSDPDRMNEAFGLYALTGKATSFLAPLLIAIVTDISGSQRIGITPLIALFLVGLFLLAWVHPDGTRRAGR